METVAYVASSEHTRMASCFVADVAVGRRALALAQHSVDETVEQSSVCSHTHIVCILLWRAILRLFNDARECLVGLPGCKRAGCGEVSAWAQGGNNQVAGCMCPCKLARTAGRNASDNTVGHGILPYSSMPCAAWP